MRAEILQASRARGRKAVAVLPILYPKALLTALDLHAVELWGPPGPPAGPAAGRIQTYVCPLARNALAFLSAGRASMVDAVLVPHTCDSLQGFASMLGATDGWEKPVFTFQHPKGEPRASSRAFLLAELRSLASGLERVAGKPLESRRLREALELHKRIDETTAFLLANRPRMYLSDPGFYRLLRRGEFLWPEDHLEELMPVVDSLAPAGKPHGVPLLVTGYVPEPMGLLEILQEAGACLAADDYAAVGRRIGGYGSVDPGAGDPMEILADALLSAPPCPTRAADPDARMEYLVRLAEARGAKGVLVHTMKFCEPELFDVPALRKTFAAAGLPLLHLESELETAASSQTCTRIEAFVEMLRAPASAKAHS